MPLQNERPLALGLGLFLYYILMSSIDVFSFPKSYRSKRFVIFSLCLVDVVGVWLRNIFPTHLLLDPTATFHPYYTPQPTLLDFWQVRLELHLILQAPSSAVVIGNLTFTGLSSNTSSNERLDGTVDQLAVWYFNSCSQDQHISTINPFLYFSPPFTSIVW